ncbi:hypothetical protein JB92DRAFT_993768 [Gautieria morchelliformis]|nr:hypothetical protein JB92DRAFT_993768 [Gautieria morchelliformis]
MPIHSILFLLLSPALATAALYPTSPINTTVFHPSTTQTNLIRWIDDLTSPSLNQLGNVTIDLLLEDTIIGTLAASIPSTYREVKLFIPPGIGPDSSDYALLFAPSSPFKPVYSARFTISNHTSAMIHALTSASPSSTFSAIISTETFGGHPSTSSAAKSTSTVTPGREKIGTTASGGQRVRLESSAQFRALYVLWPVLVGAALAS